MGKRLAPAWTPPDTDPIVTDPKKSQSGEAWTPPDTDIIVKKKGQGGEGLLTTGSLPSPASDYRATVSQLSQKIREHEDDGYVASGLISAIDKYPENSLSDPQKRAEYDAIVKEYNSLVKLSKEREREIRNLQAIGKAQKAEYDTYNQERQEKLFSMLGLDKETKQDVINTIFKQQHPDKIKDVDLGRLVPTSVDVDADDLAKAITGKSFEDLERKQIIQDNKDVFDRTWGAFKNSVVKTLAFDLPGLSAQALSAKIASLKIKDSTDEDSYLKPGAINQMKKLISLVPGAKESVNELVDSARYAALEFGESWKNSDQIKLRPFTPGMGEINLYNDKDLIKSISQINTPLDAVDFVFASLGQGVAQIVPAIATRGLSSYLQELGGNYSEGVMAIAEKLSIEEGREVTPQEVQARDLDEPLIAEQYAILQASLDMISARTAVNASKVLKAIGKKGFSEDLKKRGLSFFDEVAKGGKKAIKAGGMEFITEGTQGGLQQMAVSQMTGLGKIDAVKKIDWLQVVDEGIAGAIGGAGVSAGSQSLSAMGKLKAFKNLKNDPDPESQKAYQDFMENVIKTAKKYGDTRTDEEIKEFVEGEVITKVEPEVAPVETAQPVEQVAPVETTTEVQPVEAVAPVETPVEVPPAQPAEEVAPVETDSIEIDKIGEIEKEMEAEVKKVAKPVYKLELVPSADLVKSADPVGNKQKHDKIKDRYKKVRELIDCL